MQAKIEAEQGLCDYKDYSITMNLPAYGAEIFVFHNPESKDKLTRDSHTEKVPRKTPRTSRKKKTIEK